MQLRSQQLDTARNSDTSPQQLRELSYSSDKQTRQLVAANPNTPTEVLLDLGAEFPKELLNNPVFTLIWLEQPDLVRVMPESTLAKLIECKAVPLFLLEQATNHPERRIRERAIAKIPVESLPALVNNTYEDIRIQLAEHPQVAIAILEQLAKDESIWVRATVASRRQTPIPVLEALAKDTEREVRRAVAPHPSLPVPILERLALESDREIRWPVAAHPQTPLPSLEILAKDSDGQVRCAVAKNPNASVELLAQLQNDKNASVSRWAAYRLRQQNEA
ncbi:HEAT repeat domain-containing protein [Oscillatoria sp. FACHB-1406]|uniref:HEAT repeat domain-containing protein n=1 Tax=Oscillatoria sp. FACHB-1406 TaxID=2692846 RepID=UPI0016869679|nr:HEAT repeat domain-containing protein [Oscillatoria sp. FACHB-1406]MBD2577073.1 HEAT repeat domain-containing protein [Oscillatoria sp. FACHB-1406]